MKRFLPLLLACTFVFSGCGGSAKETTTTKATNTYRITPEITTEITEITTEITTAEIATSKNNEQALPITYSDIKTGKYNGQYVRYGVTTYIYIDVPILGDFIRVPVYGESNRVFCFEGACSNYIVTLD